MSRRTSGMLAALALVAAAVAAVSVAPSADAGAGDPVPYCSAPAAPPCLLSFTRDGSAASPTYRVLWQEQSPGAGFYSFYVEKFVGSSWTGDLGTADTSVPFALEFDFGTFDPRTFGGLGSPQGADPVVWSGDSTDHRITINTSPVDMLFTTCDPTCQFTAGANEENHGYLFGVVNNGEWIGDTEAQHELSNGTYNFRNTQLGEATPLLGTDASGNPTMVFDLANAHENAAHVTFQGEQHVRLPNDVLRVELGIPDPDTMTWSSLTATVSGSSTGAGTLHVTPETGHDAMRIDLTGVTFSARKVTIRTGIIKPTAPTALTGKRRTSTTGFLDWDKSLPRGARPTSYQSKCYTPGASSIITTSRYTYMTVKGLRSGKHYSCTVRARSSIGYSSWSSSVGRL